MKGGGSEAAKRRAGESAATAVEDGMVVGLGTGSTAAHTIRKLGRRVDADAWAALLGAFDPVERFAFEYGLDLSDRPVTETMAAGTVRGWKGRVMVLDRNGSTYAVDARDLVGYELTETVPDRELQSSLGAFGG